MSLKHTVHVTDRSPNYWVVPNSKIAVKDRKSCSSKPEEYYHLSTVEKVTDGTLPLADKPGLSPFSARLLLESDGEFLDDLNLYHNVIEPPIPKMGNWVIDLHL